ncbi:hypothetical protein [Marinomonas primoryensis]|uniref:hypothetical protein n=1 Tax=Marinomonas primoryensis TaxID=178399 RepID=UPI003704A4D5
MISHSYIAKSSDLLARHVLVHDELFGFSLRKLIPIPFLFAKIDHAYLWSESEEIHHELKRLVIEIEGNPLTLDLDSIFTTYLIALSESADKLAELLKKLSQKSNNINSYEKADYLADLKAYNFSQTKYSQLGQQLNEHFSNKI